MAIGQFLNLQKEKVDNDLEIIINKIAKAYSTGNRIHKTNKKDVVIFKIGYFEAIQALQKLCLYEK